MCIAEFVQIEPIYNCRHKLHFQEHHLVNLSTLPMPHRLYRFSFRKRRCQTLRLSLCFLLIYPNALKNIFIKDFNNNILSFYLYMATLFHWWRWYDLNITILVEGLCEFSNQTILAHIVPYLSDLPITHLTIQKDVSWSNTSLFITLLYSLFLVLE